MASQLPWVEKYRPQTIKDITYQNEIVSSLETSIANNNIPHLLMYGPPGTGKTSTIIACCRQLFGPLLFKERIYQLNASDERGIDAVRNKIKMFSKRMSNTDRLRFSKEYLAKYPCPDIKIIILDEADSMTREAQAALRMIMEKYYKITRFCIICNYINKIIEPIISRCVLFRYKPLNKESIFGKLANICKLEDIKYMDGDLDMLIKISKGDMRKAITYLQSASLLKNEEGYISSDDIIELSRNVPEKYAVELIHLCLDGNLDGALGKVEDIHSEGYSLKLLLGLLNNIIVLSEDVSDDKKANICLYMGEVDYKISCGADEYLQLLDVVCHIIKNMHC